MGRYKDQKTYSYWDSGFVNTLFTYEPPEKYSTIFVYGSGRSSLTAFVNHKLWILVKKEPVQILTCWCSCMAGTSQSCNHAIAVMYKIEYGVFRKGYLDPACTSVPCVWNQSTKKEIEPKMIKDINIRKKLRSKEKDAWKLQGRNQKKRPTEIQSSSATIPEHYRRVSFTALSQFKTSFTRISCEKYSDNERLSNFLKILPINTEKASRLEIKTRGQSENELWKEARIGRLTAS